MPPNLGGFFMVRSYYPSECHADYFDFERIEALKPAIEACGISTLSQSPMLGFHKQMDNRIKLLEEILSLNLPFKALMFLTLMRPSIVLFLVLWLKLVKDFLKVRCRLALLPFLISCLIWLDLVASLPLIKERILVIILLLHFLSLMLGSVLVLMLPLLVWLTPDLRIKKSLLKCNWTIRKRLPRCKMRLKKRLLAFSRRLHARIRKTRYMHKMRCLLINRRSLLLALRLLWKTPIFPSNSRFPRLCAKCLLKLKRLVSILPMTKSKK